MATSTELHAFVKLDVSTRSLNPLDIDAVEGLLGGLDERDSYFRFFGARPKSLRSIASSTCTDDPDRTAVGAFVGDRLIGVANYVCCHGARAAEAALVVAHDVQMHGVGTLLLDELCDRAISNGVGTLYADVLTENARMVTILRELRCPVTYEREGHTVRARIDLAATSTNVSASRPLADRSGA